MPRNVENVMKFSEVVNQAVELLRTRGRVTYRVLKREFALDDESLEDLKEQLIDAEELATDKDDKMLVWTGDETSAATPQSAPSESQAPASYTPQHLAERIRAEQVAMESRGAADGERKTITALFADLKGSTALIEGLDPEDARAIIDPALQLMMDAVHRYDGYVAQALGDGIFALFGAPIAHEDHPQRALYAALRMQEEMRQHSDQSRLKGGIPLQLRVGINTGEVVVRSIRKDDLHTDYVPVGHSTNLAARMEQMATPGSIVISEYTQKLTEGYFDLKALGAAEIKGVEEPLNVYEVMGAGPLRTRLQVSARRGLTRFVGRHGEMEQLQGALDQAKAGHGQIVGVLGEPGLGKSRLFYEFKQTSQSGCLVLEAFAVSHGQASPYLPVIELLKEYLDITPEDDERKRREKVTGKVLALDRSLEDTLPYLFALLGIEDPSSSLQQMDAQIRRQRTFEALKKLFLRESLNQPLILVFEDLHWIDTETQGFLDVLSERVASAQLLVLVNYRPEYRHEWGQKTYYTQLRLAPLGKAEAEEFLTFLLGTDASLTSLKALILERTDGTPFFMEEVVQTLVEEGALQGERGRYQLETTPTELHISPTVQGVLAARIDRLAAEEKALLQQLSVIGRQFPVSLVKRVVTQSETELYRVLSSLQAKEYLYEQPAFPESEYIFKHALTQDVAYGTVLQEQRKALHERTGQALETLYEEKLEDHYSELAHHYGQSDDTEKAVEYLGLAGEQAVQRSANVEAIGHLTRALELLRTLADSPVRQHKELTMLRALGDSISAMGGWAEPRLEQIYTRMLELSQQVGDPAQHFSAQRGMVGVYVLRGDLQTGYKAGQELLRLAQVSKDSGFLLEAHHALSNTVLALGKLKAGKQHCEQGVALYDPQVHHTHVFRYGHDPKVCILVHEAFALWSLGYPDQAWDTQEGALDVAQRLDHPFSLAEALTHELVLLQLRGSLLTNYERGISALNLTVDQGFSSFMGWIQVLLGWRLVKQGQQEEGIKQLRQGLEVYRTTGSQVWLPCFLSLLAEAYATMGKAKEGLSVLSEAFSLVEQNAERWWEAELYRLKGEFLLQQSLENQPESENCFRQAIKIAQQQEAKSWELRAATSLARLWQGQGKRAEAQEVLAPVYDWFTEGFDTADLQDAKTLLEKLS